MVREYVGEYGAPAVAAPCVVVIVSAIVLDDDTIGGFYDYRDGTHVLVVATEREWDRPSGEGSFEWVVHHEFSNVLRREFPSAFSADRWLALLPVDHRYLSDGGFEAIRTGQSGGGPTLDGLARGFVTEYAESSYVEDVSETVAAVMTPSSASLWLVARVRPALRSKLEFTVSALQESCPGVKLPNDVPQRARRSR